MPAMLSLSESQVMIALRSFLLDVLPEGVPVEQAQVNRVAEPNVLDFVLMNSVLRERLSTNIDSYADCLFQGRINGSVLTVVSVEYGTLAVGRRIFGTGVVANTTIVAPGSGSGGIGTYNLNIPQTLPQRALACGITNLLQPTQVTIQIDVHGPASGNNAQIIHY